MAFPTAVNSQITDAISQCNTIALGECPASVMAHLYQTIARSPCILFQNSIWGQQQPNKLKQDATNMGIMQIYSVDTEWDAQPPSK